MTLYLEPISVKEKELLIIAEERNKTLISLRSYKATPVSFNHQRKWVAGILEGDDRYFFIYQNKQFVGYCGLDKIHPVNRTAEINLMVIESARHKKFGKLTIKNLLQTGFEELYLNCIFGEVYNTTNSWEFWKKCGFKMEGILKERKYWHGEFYSSVMFSLTADQWRKL